jgi:hypothetical protein
MALFIRRFSKLMSKQKFFKGYRKEKFRSKTKRACYNCVKYGHYIANSPYECREKDDEKKKKSYNKDKHYKKKPMVRRILARSGTSMMRAPTPIVKMSLP